MMKKYDSYIDSGVDWMGNVPKHWTISKVKYSCSTQKGKTPKNLSDIESENSLPYLSMDYLRGEPNQTFYVSNEETVVLTEEKETLLLWDGSNAGEFIKSKKGVLSSTMALIKSDSINKSFQWYFFKGFEILLKDSCNGMGIPHVDGKLFRGSPFLIPPSKEQTQISNYLDHKTTQIDELISKKGKLIELLNEERTAIINQVVTKGLDPNVSMKDSGIEWLGEIPKHWEVSKIKHEFNVQGGGTPSKENPSYWSGDIPWVSPKDMKQKEITDTIDKTNLLGISNSSSKVLESESLLMVVRSGILQRTIPIGINKTPVSLNQDIKSFSSKGCLLINLFYYFIKGWESHLLEDWSKEGATVESIEMGYLLNFPIPKPPIDEQNQIINYINAEENKIELTMSLSRKEIELLKEYKTALISEVVTGKVDVRNEEIGCTQ